MTETLFEFRQRTQGFSANSLPGVGAFGTNPGLTVKVDDNGRMKPYVGNTMVFLLTEECKVRLSCIQEELYYCCGEMLADRLHPDTFHMTLHDLVNGVPGLGLWKEARIAAEEAELLLEQLRAKYTEPVHMRSTWLFNMVNTSVVLGLEPADEASCFLLMTLYEHFEKIVRLGYKMTPHITLAYYKPGVYGDAQRGALQKVFERVSRQEKMMFELPVDSLELLWFDDMNQYIGRNNT